MTVGDILSTIAKRLGILSSLLTILSFVAPFFILNLDYSWKYRIILLISAGIILIMFILLIYIRNSRSNKLKDILSEEDDTYRRHQLRDLAGKYMCHVCMIRLLVKFIKFEKNQDLNCKKRAIQDLAVLYRQSSGTIDHLSDFLNNSFDSGMMAVAAEQLATFNDPNVKNILLTKGLTSQHTNVVCETTKGLKNFPDNVTLKMLCPLLRHQNYNIKHQVMETIEHLTLGIDIIDLDVIKYVDEILQKETAEDICILAIDTLRHIGPDACDALQTTYESKISTQYRSPPSQGIIEKLSETIKKVCKKSG